ncbi:MAG: FAD-binding oxidoreductase [Candidatus Delongbacteria bacterium]|nr:FAD-binding oxidoreductase [Candidatus Delongbacteria bacterium]MBN2833402.1 FAD-binding oxidoreductase [Candidatus Delongbacteria bacterium]
MNKKLKSLLDYQMKTIGDYKIVYPTNSNEVIEIIDICKTNSLKIVPCGFLSQIEFLRYSRNTIFVSSLKLDEIVLDNVNCFIEMKSGVNYFKLSESLKKKEIYLPLQINRDSTAGSVVSTSDPFSQFSYYVKGVNVILADGSIIKYGCKTLKNVAGYDLTKLVTGTFGSFGFIESILIQYLKKDEVDFEFEDYNSINMIREINSERNKLWLNLKKELDPENLFI